MNAQASPKNRPLKQTRFTVEHLWQLDRLGAPNLSPDGSQAVVRVTSSSLEAYTSSSSLWVLSQLGHPLHQLTSCVSLAIPPIFSHRRDQIV